MLGPDPSSRTECAVDWSYVIYVIATCLMAAVALFEWQQNRGRHKVGKIKEIIDLSLKTALAPVTERLSVVETKIDVYWRSVALGQANVLHQPDPRRRHIDVLLEAFSDGTITTEQGKQLKGYLRTISEWEPGQKAAFPIHPGEPGSAAMLLSHLEHESPE